MTQSMTYDDAVATLEDALKFGMDPSLEPIRAMCAAMGDPQKRYRCVQVAGTNGKSSTTRMIAALLHAQGLRVGLYVSPHLIKYPERIEIDGRVVSDEDFARGIEVALDAAARAGVQATEFELLTAAALWLFAREDVDWAVLECGLGGRWDATSIVDPQVAVITGVALEHTAILGDTIEKIAGEKAAIIKPGSHAIFAHDLAAQGVFERQAQDVGAPYSYAKLDATRAFDDELAYMPAYQRSNLATALAAVTVALGHAPSPESVSIALGGLVIPGRFEILRHDPLVIVDAAHNPQSAHVLAGELRRLFDGDAAIPTLLLGVLDDKDARGIIRELCPLFDRIVVTASSSTRAVPATELASLVAEETGVRPEATHDVRAAQELLSGEPIVATGSITVAGEVKGIWC
ncbi:MAG: bifunctional folylpolyglutamate synthase/dihydrofolate synthase [Bacteroidales bacterium]